LEIAIDFIGPLKSATHYDMILSCTCRLSGYTQLIPTLQSHTAEKTATCFFTGWISLFGAPISIISDRDKLWTSKFWQSLMARTSTKFHMTSLFHPQADGRSERTNKTVGQILRTFTFKRQGKWLETLPSVEFAINSAINVATGVAPFEVLLRRRPTLFRDQSTKGEPTALGKWVNLWEKFWADTRDQLCASCVKQAIQHNCHTTAAPSLDVGSKVLLNTADWRGRQPGTNKLKKRFEGPYPVIRVFNHGQSIEIKLPDGDKRHPVFHVSKLKPFVGRETTARILAEQVSSSQSCTAA
jgi:hypothetical protein